MYVLGGDSSTLDVVGDVHQQQFTPSNEDIDSCSGCREAIRTETYVYKRNEGNKAMGHEYLRVGYAQNARAKIIRT